MTVANKPGHRGEHEGNRKTIARGMPGEPGVTVVTTPVCFLLATRGCGRMRRPAFLAPSVSESGIFTANLARGPRRDRGAVPANDAVRELTLVCRKTHSSCPDLIRASIYLRKSFLRTRWIAGSSPATTS